MSSSKQHQSDKPATKLPPRRRENETGEEFRTRYSGNEREETQDSREREDLLYDQYIRTGGIGSREVFSRRRYTGTVPPVPIFGQNDSQQTDNSRPSETPQAREPSAQNETETVLQILPPYYSPDRPLAPVIITSKSGYVMEPLPPYNSRPSETSQAGEPSPQTIPPDNFTQYGSPSNTMRGIARESPPNSNLIPQIKIGTTQHTSGNDRWEKERKSGGHEIRSGMGKVFGNILQQDGGSSSGKGK
ncbi:b2a8e5f0-76f3-44b4-8f54-357ce2823c9f [Sclerotinia trifoliorum]|uniref:B2a8e5f0-76f3-44b4-8f54-357ce2823c9f n=1 Tax=Sclerotinia trifoliorum TaxID=28548 RepID=A0A8H2W3R0_9HELO|nr:b2a8e5f0-76f3-44b4-8f54-357ce2823c9f [Sclerotinia trifoliorum]